MSAASLHFGHPLCALGQLYVLLLIARAIFSWFPLSPGSGLIPIVRFLHTVTEPVLAPLRRVIPPVGMFDLSFLVAFFVLQLVIVPLLCQI
ncbi:MAG TPA: YggT family protein [Acidimicrobiales bacterium]|nr:YggT family protein [Acidimicrobiales bacterium]